MDESNTAVVVGNDVELWSVSRTSAGFSCIRTIYADAVRQARKTLTAAEWNVRPDHSDALGAVFDRVFLSHPSATAARSFSRSSAVLAFFVGEREGDTSLFRQAQYLIFDVAPDPLS